MSDLRSTIDEDIEWYEFLCKKYGEEPVRDEHGVDPYSDHAYDLLERYAEDSIR
jgi:hypothetical protein